MLRRRIEEGYPNQAFTLFAPIGMAEDLTKIEYTLCNVIKTELQALKESVTAILFTDLKNKVKKATTNLEERVCGLEDRYNELKEIILHRTTLHVIIDPSLLERWDPATMVLKHCPRMKMRLVLNKTAADNITDLFPTDWHPKPPLSNVQEKHFKILTEVMTEMFLQCGILIEADTIEMDHYQDFLKALYHHTIMGNVSTTQLDHFIILMIYMSFCRLKHYTVHMVDRNAALLKSVVWMSLVIISFRTTSSMKGSHYTINPYFKNLPSVVRRSVHVVVTRYMEQDCTCQNNLQCDIYPTTLTSEIVLPSYQHFLQHIHQTGMTKKVSNESDALGQYGKTIQMLILTRVNGYYSPYSPQTIMEEEAKSQYGDVFTLAEKDFFKHRLLTLNPKITDEEIEISITFLEKQKLANCPCFVHTEQRGFEWIVFRRQPDKITCDCDDIPEIEDDATDDEDFFSAEDDSMN